MVSRRKRAPLVRAANDPEPELPKQTPREKVIGTTELLESILSFLPLKDLLRCRQLSKRVKDVIDGSIVLRETMFLHPTRVPREAWRLDPEFKGHSEGITSVRPAAGMVPLPGRDAVHLQGPSPHAIRTPAILNPIFPDRRDRVPDDDDSSRDEYSSDQCDTVHTSDVVFRKGTGDLNRQDINLDMYLTQPPCRQAWVEALFYIPRGLPNPSEVYYLLCKGFLELGAGITIRDLLNTASTVRGVVSVVRWAPKPPKKKKRWSYTHWEPRKYKRVERHLLLPEIFHDATILEILGSLDLEDAVPSANEVRPGVDCWLIDTIVTTDEMWARVAPYTEDATK